MISVRRTPFKYALVRCRGPFSSSTKEGLTVYGHYVSQPSRAVLWLLKIHNKPFNFVKIDVLKGEARSDPYKQKFPTCLIPGIEDGDFCLAEGSAIMQYLCEKNGWENWWPIANDEATRKKRAKIAEYLSSHHHTNRLISHTVVRPLFSKPPPPEEQEANLTKALKLTKRFESVFLKEGKYVNGMEHPSIADLLAYTEIGQLLDFRIVSNFEGMPILQAWLLKLKELPFHDDVHHSNRKLGEILSISR